LPPLPLPSFPTRRSSDLYFLVGPSPAPPPGFGIETAAEFLAALNGSHITGGIFVANGIPFPIHLGLGEHTTQFDFAGVSRFPVLLAGTAFSFLAHYRDARAIHLYIEDGNARPHRDGQVQLHGLRPLALLPRFDVGSDGFRRALYCLGRDRQTGQQLHLLASLLERQ